MVENKSRSAAKLSIKEAAQALVEIGVLTRTQFDELKRKKLRPANIPAHPDKFYPDYPGWKHFIALGYPDAKEVSYDNLKKLNALKNITSKHAFKMAIKSKLLPPHTPVNPEAHFVEEWVSWEEFLAPSQRFIGFEEARKFARRLGLKSSYEWRAYCRSGSKPSYIPVLPDRDYDEFVSWQDFLIADDK